MITKITAYLLLIALFVYAGSASAFTESTSGTENDFFGYGAGGSSGNYNAFFGKNTGIFNAGNWNTFLGYEAGHSNSDGWSNTFVGYNAGNSNTEGFRNTFIGDLAGESNDTGAQNTFVGRAAGAANTTGVSNVFIGFGTGVGNTSGGSNTFIGTQAGNVGNGQSNVFIGNFAGRFNNQDNNVFIGTQAGYTNTTGSSNTFIGFKSGHLNDTGSGNIIIGDFAGYNNDDDFNIFLGSYAGYSNTAGNSNTFIGYYSGYSNNSGKWNTFLGLNAGYSNTTGNWNTFIGEGAGYSNTEGYDNTFLGEGAGFSNQTGNMNVFLGFNAGYYETGSNRLYIENSTSSSPLIYGEFDNDLLRVNGTFEATGNIDTNGVYKIGGTQILKADNINTFLGDGAGVSNTTGRSNTFIGQSAGYANNSGKWNTFLGMNAGYSNTNGNWNTFIGEGAGYSNTGGYDNTFIGEGAGFSNQTGNMNVFLGFNAGYYETGSNRLYIENSTDSNPLIYGEFDNNIVKINGKLGVGTIPTSQLTVAGIIESTAGGIKFSDGSTITSANIINADTLDGLHSGAFALSAHVHSGADITSGTVGEAYVDALIARDSEIMPTVIANDGSGSTLDADLLDGQDSTAFMSASTDNWVNISGDTMTGDLSVNSNLFVTGTAVINTDLYVDGNIYAESDARSKKDIQPIESSLNKIQNIQGIKYKWNSEENGANDSHYGVIAQEVAQVLPEIVKEGKNGKKKVAYIELIPVLIEAMKEQQEIYNVKFKNQQEIISKLLAKVEKLEREVKLNNSMAMANIE